MKKIIVMLILVIMITSGFLIAFNNSGNNIKSINNSKLKVNNFYNEASGINYYTCPIDFINVSMTDMLNQSKHIEFNDFAPYGFSKHFGNSNELNVIYIANISNVWYVKDYNFNTSTLTTIATLSFNFENLFLDNGTIQQNIDTIFSQAHNGSIYRFTIAYINTNAKIVIWSYNFYNHNIHYLTTNLTVTTSNYIGGLPIGYNLVGFQDVATFELYIINVDNGTTINSYDTQPNTLSWNSLTNIPITNTEDILYWETTATYQTNVLFTYNITTNTFSSMFIIENSGGDGTDANDNPFYYAFNPNGTVSIFGAGEGGGGGTAQTQWSLLLNKTLDLSHATSFTEINCFGTSDFNAYAYRTQSLYGLEGETQQPFATANEYDHQAPYVDLINKTAIISTNSWFNHQVQTIEHGYYGGEYYASYYAINGYENVIPTSLNSTFTLYWLPSKVANPYYTGNKPIVTSPTSPNSTTVLDGFKVVNKKYDYTNFSVKNIDYNISETNGYAGSVINMANNFTGAYYVQNNGTLVEQNFITNHIYYLAHSPLLYLKYDYLNYHGEYYGEMPYYNSNNTFVWIFIYGTNPSGYFEMWGYNLVNGTIVNYTENSFTMSSNSNTNFQITYVGNGYFIGIGNGISDYYTWNFYSNSLVYSGNDPFSSVEANNIYYIPQYNEFLDVWADGTTTDNLQYAKINNGIISSPITISTGDTYTIGGVSDIIVNIKTNNVWINDGSGRYGLIIILHWTGSSFNLVDANYTNNDYVNGYNNYVSENDYIPIITTDNYIQTGVGAYGSPTMFFINEFNKTGINITGLSGKDISWAEVNVHSSGNGNPIGIHLPEFRGSYLNSTDYAMWFNSTNPHVFYVWNSSLPENLNDYVINNTNVFRVNFEAFDISNNSFKISINNKIYNTLNNYYNIDLVKGNYVIFGLYHNITSNIYNINITSAISLTFTFNKNIKSIGYSNLTIISNINDYSFSYTNNNETINYIYSINKVITLNLTKSIYYLVFNNTNNFYLNVNYYKIDMNKTIYININYRPLEYFVKIYNNNSVGVTIFINNQNYIINHNSNITILLNRGNDYFTIEIGNNEFLLSNNYINVFHNTTYYIMLENNNNSIINNNVYYLIFLTFIFMLIGIILIFKRNNRVY